MSFEWLQMLDENDILVIQDDRGQALKNKEEMTWEKYFPFITSLLHISPTDGTEAMSNQ